MCTHGHTHTGKQITKPLPYRKQFIVLYDEFMPSGTTIAACAGAGNVYRSSVLFQTVCKSEQVVHVFDFGGNGIYKMIDQ